MAKCLPTTFRSLSASLFLALSAGIHTIPAAQADTTAPIPQLYAKVARQEQVPVSLLYSISLTESTNPETKKVWPWTINVKGKGYYFPTREKAYKAIHMLMEKGITSIDIGLMQTNWYWHSDKLKHPWKALDPEFNITIGAKILRQCYDRTTDWWYCAGEYHSRSDTPERKARVKKYQERVLSYLKVYMK